VSGLPLETPRPPPPVSGLPLEPSRLPPPLANHSVTIPQVVVDQKPLDLSLTEPLDLSLTEPLDLSLSEPDVQVLVDNGVRRVELKLHRGQPPAAADVMLCKYYRILH
jgi:hypothetical protein